MNILLFYIFGSFSTLIFLTIAFVIINYKYETKATWKDFWLSILGIALWPIFWFLLIISQFRKIFF